MGPAKDGVFDVRCFVLPAGVGEGGEVLAEPLRAIVRWRSNLSDRLYQVYAGGRFAGVTTDSEQRQMVVQIPSGGLRVVRVEVFSVELGEADIDFSGELYSGGGLQGRARVCWPRRQVLPFEGTFQVYGNSGAGEVDYSSPVVGGSGRLWASRQDKCGFGLSRFGRSDFGFDGSAAVGFGKGGFGLGEFGLDADMVSWTSGELEAGNYRFGVQVADRFGNETDGSVETDNLTVPPAAAGGEQLEAVSYDRESNELVLKVT